MRPDFESSYHFTYYRSPNAMILTFVFFDILIFSKCSNRTCHQFIGGKWISWGQIRNQLPKMQNNGWWGDRFAEKNGTWSQPGLVGNLLGILGEGTWRNPQKNVLAGSLCYVQVLSSSKTHSDVKKLLHYPVDRFIRGIWLKPPISKNKIF